MNRVKSKQDFKQYVADRRPVLITHVILNILVLAALVRAIWLQNWDNAFLCIAVLFLFLIPHFLRKNFRIELPNALEIIMLIFIFCAEILGELQCYFLQYTHWDTMLHTTWGFLCAAVGFSLVDILNRDTKIKFNLSPFFVAAAAFCFSMTVGVFWEFFEFAMDLLTHSDMQKDTVIANIYSTYLDPLQQNIPYSIKDISETVVNGKPLPIEGYLDIGLFDTMEDLFVNFIGAFVFSIIGYFYIKQRGKGKIAKAFIPVLKEAPHAADQSTGK